MVKVGLVKKRVKKFNRHHSDRYYRLKTSWRKPKGIDSCVRRKFKGRTLMPNIGYGSDKKTRNLLSNNLTLVRVNNLRELKSLGMSNRKIVVEFSKKIGSSKKKLLLDTAMVMDIKINNPILK